MAEVSLAEFCPLHYPYLERCPNFNTAHWLAHPNIVRQPGEGDDVIVAQLVDAWTAGNDAEKVAWDAQVAADKVIADAAEAQRLADIAAADQAKADEAALERKEAEKKKPKAAPIDFSATIPSHLASRPAAAALHKLKNLEFVDLWHFTVEGCRDAMSNRLLTSDETLNFVRSEGSFLLQPQSALTSKNVIPDANLTWDQMSIAKNCLLEEMKRTGTWPVDHIKDLTVFFLNLDRHPMREASYGPEILLLYMAKARREWHDSIRNSEPGHSVFPISKICGILLESIRREYMHELQTKQLESTNAETRFSRDRDSNHRRPRDRDRRDLESIEPPRNRSRRYQRLPSPPPTRSRVRSQSPPRSQHPNRTFGRPTDPQVFSSGAESPGNPVCAICLSRRPHSLRTCHASKLWNGSPARCTRNRSGYIYNPKNEELCLDWQRAGGCASRHSRRHECSGCGDASHGASHCSLAQAS